MVSGTLSGSRAPAADGGRLSNGGTPATATESDRGAGTGDGPLPFPVEQFGHALAAWLDRVAGSHELPTGEFQVPVPAGSSRANM